MGFIKLWEEVADGRPSEDGDAIARLQCLIDLEQKDRDVRLRACTLVLLLYDTLTPWVGFPKFNLLDERHIMSAAGRTRVVSLSAPMHYSAKRAKFGNQRSGELPSGLKSGQTTKEEGSSPVEGKLTL
jgi:hypothetical protein